MPSFQTSVFHFSVGVGSFEDALVSVDGAHLRGLFVHGHLAEEVGDALVGGELGIFVGVLFAILIPVNPSVLIDFCGEKGAAGEQEGGGERVETFCEHG